MRGFTTTCREKNVLKNGVNISNASSSNNENIKINQFIATWDTGATNTVISEKVVKECGLIPTGMIKVSTAGGIIDAYTYVIDIVLPDEVKINNLKVTGGKLGDTDVLIGMDIITRGDFAVSNYNGQLRFTYREPSLQPIDFVKDRTIKIGEKIRRNDPCWCGSNKKYKNCHGK